MVGRIEDPRYRVGGDFRCMVRSDGWDNYKCSVGHITGLPIIESMKSGKQFTLTWSELIEMARAAGIDERG